MRASSIIHSGGSRAWRSYNGALARRPVATKIATGVVGSILGDSIAQHCSKGRSPGAGFSYDWERTGRLVAYTAMIGTPLAHMWFSWLDAAVLPGQGGLAPVLAKMLLDQSVMAPLGTMMFYLSLGMMEGQRPRDALTAVRAKLAPTLAANYTLWPCAHCINFGLVPSEQRILFVNIIGVFWVSYLSSMAARGAPEQQPAAA